MKTTITFNLTEKNVECYITIYSDTGYPTYPKQYCIRFHYGSSDPAYTAFRQMFIDQYGYSPERFKEVSHKIIK